MKKSLIIFAIVFNAFSCQLVDSQWSDETKSKFLTGCLKTSVKNYSNEKAIKVCNCFLQKSQNKFPDSEILLERSPDKFAIDMKEEISECKKTVD